MLPHIICSDEYRENITTGVLAGDFEPVSLSFLKNTERKYLEDKLQADNECSMVRPPQVFFFSKIPDNDTQAMRLEKARKSGSKFYELLKQEKKDTVQLISYCEGETTLAFLEGLLLSCYTFSKYKNKKEDYFPAEIFLTGNEVNSGQITGLLHVIQAVFHCRNLVNEPLSYLNATCFSKEMEALGREAGFTVEIFNRKKIEALRMGGLLAVNKGSIDPPTFTIAEWKPENARNMKPIVLVGKGVVFDTGGLSLKPTPKSMDYMKCDMAGGAVVASVLYAAAKNRLPVHIIGLVPATDNRPDGNACVPGDVITMFDGTTVEIKNTDAEGRLLLADALSYSKKYDPGLVIDIATLTGSAEIISGQHGMVVMGTDEKYLSLLKASGEMLFERMVEVPLWDEYAKPLKSDIADLNNLGVREGQTSIAGKFLQHFISFPWIHMDIAGVAWLHEKDAYRPAGGTGFGVRLLYHFLKLFN